MHSTSFLPFYTTFRFDRYSRHIIENAPIKWVSCFAFTFHLSDILHTRVRQGLLWCAEESRKGCLSFPFLYVFAISNFLGAYFMHFFASSTCLNDTILKYILTLFFSHFMTTWQQKCSLIMQDDVFLVDLFCFKFFSEKCVWVEKGRKFLIFAESFLRRQKLTKCSFERI
jgi:hypothetical protein